MVRSCRLAHVVTNTAQNQLSCTSCRNSCTLSLQRSICFLKPNDRYSSKYQAPTIIPSIHHINKAPIPLRGHASEKPELPSGLAAAGVVFLGPPSRAMAALGDKIGSTILAQSAGVPTIPWSGSGVVWRPQPPAVAGDIPTEVYGRACVHSLDDALECCRRIGYPVMLKASWGGGGKGIRKVHQDEEVRAVFRQIQGEVPGSPIFAMKLAPQSRHLEVQLLCDMYAVLLGCTGVARRCLLVFVFHKAVCWPNIVVEWCVLQTPHVLLSILCCKPSPRSSLCRPPHHRTQQARQRGLALHPRLQHAAPPPEDC